MEPKVLKSDKPKVEAPLQVVAEPPAPPAPPDLPVHDFDKSNPVVGLYMGKCPSGHKFVANGDAYVLPDTDEFKTVNEALALDGTAGQLISVEYLGYNDAENRGNFEVSIVG